MCVSVCVLVAFDLIYVSSKIQRRWSSSWRIYSKYVLPYHNKYYKKCFVFFRFTEFRFDRKQTLISSGILPKTKDQTRSQIPHIHTIIPTSLSSSYITYKITTHIAVCITVCFYTQQKNIECRCSKKSELYSKAYYVWNMTTVVVVPAAATKHCCCCSCCNCHLYVCNDLVNYWHLIYLCVVEGKWNLWLCLRVCGCVDCI